MQAKNASILLMLGAVSMTPLYAQSVDIGNFYYRDFLDFGQNKGAFQTNIQQAGAQNITLQGKDGSEFSFPHASTNASNLASIPDFSAKSNFGSFTSLGGSYAVTANHIRSIENQTGWRKWGQTTYEVAGKFLGQGLDSQFLRFNRFIVEGEAELLETSITNHTTSHAIIKQPGTTQYSQQVALEQANEKILNGRLEEIKNANGGTLYAYGAGSGLLSLQVGRDYLASDLPMTEDGRLGGVLSTLSFVKGYSSFANLTSVGENEKTDGRGLNIQLGVNQTFKNTISMGDSGGAFYIYDSTKGKWVVLGVVSGTEGPNNTRLSFAAQADFEKLKKEHTQSINLANGNYTLISSYITKESGNGEDSKSIYDNKDIEFSGGGSVKFGSLIKGQNIGFIFKDEANATTYDFTADNVHFGYEGLGLDIGKNVSVDWELRNGKTGQNEALHKIGEGTLIIKTNYTPTNGALGYMRLGEGKVLLDTTTKVYDGIYITSGRGILALAEGKPEALGAIKQSGGGSGGNSYTLAQDSVNNLGFYFGNNGGKLDLGGNSLSLNVISANDAKAVITNSANTASNFSIQGFSYDKSGNKTTTKADYIVHASFEGNLNLVQKNATKGDESLVFDGNIDIGGKLESENANIILQGHPTAHAVVDEAVRKQVEEAEKKTGYTLPAWMDLSRPSTLQQPDWDKRSFKIAGGIELKNSNFTLGRSASLESNITADARSKLNFGGKINHFIDKSDGSNTRGNGFNFYQEVSKGVLENEANDTISYKGKITASGATIESSIHDFNASLDLSAGASLKASYLTLSKEQASIKLSGASSASVDNLIISGLSALGGFNIEAGSKFEIKQSFIFDNASGFNLSALDSAGFTSQPANYDLIARNKSSINGTSKDLIANVAFIGGSSATLKSLTLKDTNTSGQSEASKLKNEVILSGENTKLTLNGNLTAQNLAGALIQLNDKASLNVTKDMIFSLNSARPSKNDKPNALDSNQTYIFINSGASISAQNLSATNMNINLSVEKDSTFGAQKILGENSAFSIALGSAQSFDIELSGGEMSLQATIDSATLNSTALDSSARADSDTSASAQATQESLQKAYENIILTSNITASQNAKIESNLASLTSSVILSDTASLNLNDGVLNLDSTHNAITLKDSASLSAQRIYAKSLSSLTLNVDSGAKLNVSEFVFDSSSVQVARYFGENLYAQNASKLKQSEQVLNQNLYLSGGSSFEGLYRAPTDTATSSLKILGANDTRNVVLTENSTLKTTTLLAQNLQTLNLSVQKDSALEIETLSAQNALVNLLLDSTHKDFKLEAYQNSQIFADSWDLSAGNIPNAGANDYILSDESSRVHFNALSITQDSAHSPFILDANISIAKNLELKNVGANTAQTQDSTRFFALQVDKELTLQENTKLSVRLDSSMARDDKNLVLNTYHTFALATKLNDNRLDKRIDFIFANEDKKLYVVSKVVGDEIKVKFLQDDPKSLSELSKVDSRVPILQAILEHNSNDDTIDRAVRTDDNALLSQYVSSVESDLRKISQSTPATLSNQILFSNNESINARILQVQTTHAQALQKLYKKIYLASSDELDIVKSLLELERAKKELEYKNNVWLNGGGGYFSGNGTSSFYGTNIGYDRIFNFSESSLLAGVMFGFGGSNFANFDIKDSAKYYNLGFYANFKRAKHELQGNLNIMLLDTKRSFSSTLSVSENASNTTTAALFNAYYKYNILLSQGKHFAHTLKPLALLALSYNADNGFVAQNYKQKELSNALFALGVGAEYVLSGKNSSYALQLLARQGLLNTQKQAFVSLSNAQNFIVYDLAYANTNFMLNFIGQSGLGKGFGIDYSFALMADTLGSYGARGDVRVSYKF